MSCNKDDDEETTCKKVEVVSSIPKQLPFPQSTMSSGFQLDPISTILLLPIMPLIALFNMQMQMISQMNKNNSSGGKVTQITREGNTLTVVEKYL